MCPRRSSPSPACSVLFGRLFGHAQTRPDFITKWISTDDNSSDLYTKNLSGPVFEKHTKVYCGIDEYMKRKDSDNTQRESVASDIEENPEDGG